MTLDEIAAHRETSGHVDVGYEAGGLGWHCHECGAGRCTGPAASWCPICGDCACPTDDRGEHVSTLSPGDYGKDDPSCPLHARGSAHAEPAPCAGRECERAS